MLLPTEQQIDDAVAVLRRGGLVAFPTETVYGLGADAANREAIQKIFAAKGRPATNPLIVHVAGEQVARQYARVWPLSASRLARRFWPGPLTIVVPKSPDIVDDVTAGLSTVGLRAPDHPLAMALLKKFAGPVAAPSANRSMRVSPTTAEHVRRELGDAVDLILDGGPCRVGIESTVLDLSVEPPAILRPGAITRPQIEGIIGPIAESIASDETRAAKSPGRHPVHYSPAAATFRFERTAPARVIQWCAGHASDHAAVLVVGTLDKEDPLRAALRGRHELIEMPADSADYARRLYATLHAADQRRVAVIWIEMPPDQPQWSAVRDRLIRASAAT